MCYRRKYPFFVKNAIVLQPKSLWLLCAFCRQSQAIGNGMPYTEFDIACCRVQSFISTTPWKYVPFLQGAILLSIKGGKLCYECNLPTLIWNALNRYPQHSSPLFTMYTSVTGSSRPKSTLHQGKGSKSLWSVWEQEPRLKIVELIPSTAFLLDDLPYSLKLDWSVDLPNAKFS